MNVPAPDARSDCLGVVAFLSRIGDRWTMLVVRALRERPRRFNDIRRTVDGISQQMLTRTLRALERDGLVARTVFATTPPQVEYALTDLGHSLAVSVRQLGEWARTHRATIDRNRSRYDTSR